MQNTELAVKTSENEVPGRGETITAGDYKVSYSVGPAKGLYEFSSGKLEWKEPEEANTHLDVLVTDAKDGRFIPGLSINATLIDRRGSQAAAAHLPFVWHPERNHYGANVKVPESGDYVLQLHIFPATFTRADKEEGKRYIVDADVTFEGVHVDV
jgi:hypothetical protein